MIAPTPQALQSHTTSPAILHHKPCNPTPQALQSHTTSHAILHHKPCNPTPQALQSYTTSPAIPHHKPCNPTPQALQSYTTSPAILHHKSCNPTPQALQSWPSASSGLDDAWLKIPPIPRHHGTRPKPEPNIGTLGYIPPTPRPDTCNRCMQPAYHASTTSQPIMPVPPASLSYQYHQPAYHNSTTTAHCHGYNYCHLGSHTGPSSC